MEQPPDPLNHNSGKSGIPKDSANPPDALTGASLHRCLQCHGISRLPDVTGDKQKASCAFVLQIDRTSKFAFVQAVSKKGRSSASAFLEALIDAVLYKIHTVLQDNGIQLTFPPRYADGPTARYMTHMFFDAGKTALNTV